MEQAGGRSIRVASGLVGAIPAVFVGQGVRAAIEGHPPQGSIEGTFALLFLLGTAVPAAAFFAGGRLRPLLARLLLLQGVFLLGFLAVEGGLRLFAGSPDRPMAWPPGLRWESSATDLPGVTGVNRFSVNSRGLRGPEPDPADEVRIVAIGGSTTACLYLDDTEEWPALAGAGLGRLLGRRVHVDNAGLPGAQTWDHLVHLRDLPDLETTDAVVVLCGINDLARHLAGTWGEARASAEKRSLLSNRVPEGAPWIARLHLVRHSKRLVDDLRARAHTDRAVVENENASWVKVMRDHRRSHRLRDDLPDLAEPLRLYGDMLRGLVRMAEKRRTRLVLMTQPTMYTPEPVAANEPLLFGYGHSSERDDFTWSTPALYRAMEAFNGEMERVAAETGTPCVPLHRLLPRDTRSVYDDCHFNEEGARRVADALVPVLAAVLRGEPLPAPTKAGPDGDEGRGTDGGR